MRKSFKKVLVGVLLTSQIVGQIPVKDGSTIGDNDGSLCYIYDDT